MVSIHRPSGYEPNTLSTAPRRYLNTLMSYSGQLRLINVIFDYSYAYRHIPVQILASFLPTTDGWVNLGSLVAFFFDYVGQHSYADTQTSYLLDL